MVPGGSEQLLAQDQVPDVVPRGEQGTRDEKEETVKETRAESGTGTRTNREISSKEGVGSRTGAETGRE